MDNTFIKLSRKIQSWRWYQDANTMRVFIHILLNANVYDHDFENITVNYSKKRAVGYKPETHCGTT